MKEKQKEALAVLESCIKRRIGGNFKMSASICKDFDNYCESNDFCNLMFDVYITMEDVRFFSIPRLYTRIDLTFCEGSGEPQEEVDRAILNAFGLLYRMNEKNNARWDIDE